MPAEAPTRERIVDEAMRLFAQQGFRATTIVQIETAVGLTPGAGGIYRHFKSKDAVLSAGIDRHLGRLAALRDIRHIFADVGDLRTQLTITARYVLAELDNEATLLGVVVRERESDVLSEAMDQLLGQTVRSFATWLAEQSETKLDDERATALANIALGGLLATRLHRVAFGLEPETPDETLVDVWVDLVASALSR